MATRTAGVGRTVTGPLQGLALTIYFVLLPYVVVSRWRGSGGQAHLLYLRLVLLALALCWCLFVGQLIGNVRRLRRGQVVARGGSAWLAALLLSGLALLITPSAGAATPAHPSASTPVHHHHWHPTAATAGVIPVALAAKRRVDQLRRSDAEPGDVDADVDILRGLDSTLIDAMRQLIGEQRSGVLDVPAVLPPGDYRVSADPVVVCALGPGSLGHRVAFARAGGALAVDPTWPIAELGDHVTALHDGDVRLAHDLTQLLRALATRAAERTLVLFSGDPRELDDELRRVCAWTTPHVSGPASVTPAPVNARRVRVELLRSDPRVVGLLEPFTVTLRRRCVEMTAYLALHRHEPVTGDRLRTRALSRDDVDASLRTLSNVASAVRRSLGVDARGPRLHPVSSSGRYETHGLDSDVEHFGVLVARARQSEGETAATLCHQALALIQGEPLASTLQGFEWFLAEGFAARLARDGEWSALTLHHHALRHGHYELAFWALQQGLLIDSFSDALRDAVGRVPRLREFGGDGAGRTEHETIGTSGAVAMSWAFGGLTKQVSQ